MLEAFQFVAAGSRKAAGFKSKVTLQAARSRKMATHIAKAALGVSACLLSVGVVCRAESKKVLVKTTPGPPMLVVKPHLQPVVVRRVSVAVTNNYTQPITALVIWGAESSGVPLAEDPVTANVYFDSVIHEGEQPMMPGQTRTEESSEPKARFRAAVFADGSTFGDPVWSERIFRHRQLYVSMIDRAVGCVEAMLLPAPQRIEFLQKLSPCPWEFTALRSTPEEQNLSFPLNQEVIRALGQPEREVQGPAVGDVRFGWYPVARITAEAQKLRRLRARVTASIPPRKVAKIK